MSIEDGGGGAQKTLTPGNFHMMNVRPRRDAIF